MAEVRSRAKAEAGGPEAERRAGRGLPRASLHAQVIDRLRDMIVEGDLAPGSRIVEADLCADLSISRTPLREALKVLASEGLVELLPHRGARVTEVTAEDATHLFELIAGLEGLAAELACARMSERDLERLRTMHERLERYHAARRRHDYFRTNQRIHHLIVTLAANPILTSTHERLLARARRARYLAILSEERWDEAMREHHDLLDALQQRDPVRAGTMWRRHVQRTGEVLRAALEHDDREGGARQLYRQNASSGRETPWRTE